MLISPWLLHRFIRTLGWMVKMGGRVSGGVLISSKVEVESKFAKDSNYYQGIRERHELCSSGKNISSEGRYNK